MKSRQRNRKFKQSNFNQMKKEKERVKQLSEKREVAAEARRVAFYKKHRYSMDEAAPESGENSFLHKYFKIEE